jgi:ATP sulfurylase
MVEATGGGIEDLDNETRFFLVNCLSYLTRSAWNKLKSAEVTGVGIEDLDVETRFFLENCLSYFTCVRSRENKLSLSNTIKHEFVMSSINFNQIIVRPTVLLVNGNPARISSNTHCRTENPWCSLVF